MKYSAKIILSILTLICLKCSSTYSQSRTVCLDRELVLKIINDKKRSNVERKELVLYREKVDQQYEQILAMDTLINLSLRRIANMDSLISDAEQVVNDQYLEITKQDEKMKKRAKLNRIGFGILTGMLILTTLL